MESERYSSGVIPGRQDIGNLLLWFHHHKSGHSSDYRFYIGVAPSIAHGLVDFLQIFWCVALDRPKEIIKKI